MEKTTKKSRAIPTNTNELSIYIDRRTEHRTQGTGTQQLKRLVYNYIVDMGINDEELQRLLYSIMKEARPHTARRSVPINYITYLYITKTLEQFTDILYDILQQAVVEYYADRHNAYRAVMRYVYQHYTNNHTAPSRLPQLHYDMQCRQYTTSYHVDIAILSHEDKQLYKRIVDRAEKSLKKRQSLYKDKAQRIQAEQFFADRPQLKITRV